MSWKNANLTVLLEDLKISFKFALKNVISFVLGMFGVLLVTALLIGLVAAIVLPIIIFTVGLEGLIQLGSSLIGSFTSLDGTAIFLFLLLIITPIIAPVTVAVGALFGMGREIVESEGTTAEGVFAWYKSKFFSLAGGGMVLFLVAIIPIGIVLAFFQPLVMLPANPLSNGVMLALGIIYYTISIGFLTMVFPAIIDGHSVIDSVKLSIRLTRTYFDRVFSLWIAYIGIAALLIIPLIGVSFFMLPSGEFTTGLAGLASYGVFAAIFLVFVFIPAVTIGLSRLYLILTAEEYPQERVVDEPGADISFVGGL